MLDHTQIDPKARPSSLPGEGGAPPYGASITRPGHTVGREVHLLDYVRVLYKRRWLALTAFLVVMITVTVYTFTVTPIFEARVELLIEPENPNVVSFKEVIEQDKAATDYYQTQYKVLQSRTLARRTLDAQKLWTHPEFAGKEPEKSFSLSNTITGIIGGVVTSTRNLFGSRQLTQAPGADETAAQSNILDVFLSRLTVTPIRNSRLVDVKYRSPDPKVAALVANSLARTYIEQNLEFKFLASKEASDWLGERLSEQRKQVEGTEVALQRYREQNDAVSLEERQNIVVQKLADLNGAVTKAKTERITKESLYNQLRGIQNDRTSIDTFPAILANTFIQQLKTQLADLQRQQAQLAEKFGDKHPDMIKVKTEIQIADAKLQGEIGKVVQSIRNEYMAARAQEISLMGALEAQKTEALGLNRKAIDYGVLQRDATANRTMFESLMQRTKETGISGELKTSNIRVVDSAEVPRNPVHPRKRTNLLLALLGGGMLAVGLAFFSEYVDNRIKSPEEVKAHLGMPFLGLVPTIPEKALGTSPPLINNGVPANFSEAFRGVRTNVLFSSAEEGSRVLAVTSTAPHEGKTLIASNLAVALAQAGQRVLLLDADMRRPRVHTLFDQVQEPGLSNVMVGDAKANDAMRKTTIPGLWVMPSGHIPPNPAELLGSPRFKAFLTTLGEYFEWVIVDSPPVLAVTDASIVAHAASGVLFVVGSEMTSRYAAQTAVEQLTASKAKFVGAVLNRVDLEQNAYYYAQYYRREYGEYYVRATQQT